VEPTAADPSRWARNIDPSVPSAARMYDFYLGGMHNFIADRDAAAQVIDAIPEVPLIARANRAFLGRAVRFLVASGIRQFLDIGSGIPTAGNVHEIAQGADPAVRVVYVDLDPVAVSHARQLLHDNDRATALLGDLRRPSDLLRALRATPGGLDLRHPVGLLLVSMLHFVPGDDAYAAVGALRDALAPGSYLAITHGGTEAFDQEAANRVQGVYRNTPTPGGLRSRAEVTRFFDGLELVPPGLVWVTEWRPDDRAPAVDPGRIGMFAAVGRKP
jgi:S-adenosyl methyltransferase